MVFVTAGTVGFRQVCCHSNFQAVRLAPTQNGRSGFSIAASQPKPGSSNWNAPKQPLTTSHYRQGAATQEIAS